MMGFFSSIARLACTRKFWVAVITAFGVFASTLAGRDFGITEESAQAVVNLAIGLAGAWGVWKATNQ